MAYSLRKHFFIFLVLFLIFCNVLPTKRAFLGAVFTKENCRLKGHIFQSFVATSQILCTQSCLSRARCYSTNFKAILTHGQLQGLCELNNEQPLHLGREDKDLCYEQGWIYSRYPKDGKDDCRWSGCQNDGVCSIQKNSYVCSCHIPWTGKYCETKIRLFTFTTLGAKGRIGPDSNLRYKETGLKTVDIKDGMQEWQVPIIGKYRIEACGASGGDGSSGKKGGKGAKVSGILALTKGDKLVILVGQRGSTKSVSDPGSGGGGTFVLSSNSVPILVAGGGGGAGRKDGLGGNDKSDASGNAAGVNGSGGLVCPLSNVNMLPNDSGSGAGYTGDGGCLKGRSHCAKVTCSEGGGSKVKKFKGGEGVSGSDCDGGFGGGGACGRYPGGGGGYSGGGVAADTVAGGGGSHKADDTWSVIKGGCNEGDGYISFIIED